jgi:hypothetical protein
MRQTNYAAQTQRWANLWQQSARLPLTWTELWMASAQTIGARVGPMAAAGLNPDARQQRENSRMVTEKAQAGLETMNLLMMPSAALPMAYWRLWSSLWRPQAASAWMPLWNLMLVAAEQNVRTLSGTARPWHRRATANARRLRRQPGRSARYGTASTR